LFLPENTHLDVEISIRRLQRSVLEDL
jgi:hypothetical protein